jgi:hypothetical protein
LEDKEIFMRATQKGNISVIKGRRFPLSHNLIWIFSEKFQIKHRKFACQLLWNKYGRNFKSAIKLLIKTKTGIIFIESILL